MALSSSSCRNGFVSRGTASPLRSGNSAWPLASRIGSNGPLRPDLLRQLKPCYPRHGMVGHHQIDGAILPQDPKSVLARRGFHHLVVEILQHGGGTGHHQGIILDQKHRAGAMLRAGILALAVAAASPRPGAARSRRSCPSPPRFSASRCRRTGPRGHGSSTGPSQCPCRLPWS